MMNRSQKLRLLLVGLTLAVVTSPASAVVLNFEDLPHEYELQGVGDEISANGYTLYYAPAAGEPYPVGFTAVGQSWRFNKGGSTAVVADSCSALTTLTADDHTAMTLASIDLAESNGDAGVHAHFVGVTVQGKIVQAEFRLNGKVGWQTFHFPNSFRNLQSVAWAQGDCIVNPPHMFDNVRVSPTK